MFAQISIRGEGSQQILQDFITFIYKFFNIILLVTVPFMGLYSRFLFRKSGYNYAEHLTLNTFISAQRHLLFLAVVPFLYFFRENSQIVLRIYISCWIVYFIWTYMQFFKPEKKILGFIKSLFAGFLFLLTNGIIIAGIYFLFYFR
jgi:hypothetical protein